MQDPNRTQLGGPPTLDPNRTLLGASPTISTVSMNVTQTIKPVQCPVCKTFNPAGMFFCIDCGLIFEKALPDDAFGAPAIQLPMLVESSGREHPVRPGRNSIGREGDILISDGRVSRRHAEIRSEDGTLKLIDLGSTNGTTVNGEKLALNEARTVTGGDTLGFGGYELQLALPGSPSANATQIAGSNKTAAISTPPKKETAPAKLVGGEGIEFALRTGVNTFGRKAENDVQISDPYVSGKHGLIDIATDGVYLTDIGSTNGTLLNDAKLVPNMRTAMGPDDVIRLGSLEFRVLREDRPADSK